MTLDWDAFDEKAGRLIEVGFAERRRQLPLAVGSINSRAAMAGAFHSSSRMLHVHDLISREVGLRAVVIWHGLVRVHQTLGSPWEIDLRSRFKSVFAHHLSICKEELDQVLTESFKSAPIPVTIHLRDAVAEAVAKHDIEIDLFVDGLDVARRNPQAMQPAPTYNFYGAVGAVQAGNGAHATVVQNLSGQERDEILGALSQVKTAIQAFSEFSGRREDLIEVADECDALVRSNNPNNSKLRGLFDVLGGAIQSIASARPAYEALKSALLPLGVTLP